MMIIGQFDAKVDVKGRTAFPKTFRKILGETFIVTKGIEHNLLIVGKTEWNEFLKEIVGKSILRKEARDIRRFILGNAFEVSLDKKARMLLPHYFRSFVGIREDIIFVGQGNYIEAWGKEMWEMYQASLEKNIGFVTERFARGEEKK